MGPPLRRLGLDRATTRTRFGLQQVTIVHWRRFVFHPLNHRAGVWLGARRSVLTNGASIAVVAGQWVNSEDCGVFGAIITIGVNLCMIGIHMVNRIED